MTVLFSQEILIDEDDVRACVIDMSPYQISVFLQAVIEGLFGDWTVDEAASQYQAIQGARDALDECSLDVAKGLRILARMLSEKFDIDDEGLGSGEGE